MKFLKYLPLVLLLLIAGCKDHKETIPEKVSDILGLKVDRPLEVVFASPQGPTTGPKDYQSISVVFNQPMKALTAEAAPIAEPFSLEPPAKGRFRWKGTATVSFEPEEPLKYGTEYKVTVPAGLSSPQKNSLADEYSFTFKTPGPTVVHELFPGDNQAVKAGEPLFLGFDQAVDPKAVSALLSYTSPKGAPSPKARPVTEEELTELNKKRDKDKPLDSAKLVAVELGEVQPATKYTLKLDKGLVGQDGPVASEKENLLDFSTLGPLKWTSQAQKGTDRPERGVTFRFNNKINAKTFKEKLRVDPPVEIKTSDYDKTDDWNAHTLYLALKPNTTYTFTIGADLEDIHGQKLGQDVTHVWKTGDMRALYHVPDGIAVLEAADTLTIPMGLRNVDKVTYRMVRLDRVQALDLLKSEGREWLWGNEAFTPDQDFTVKKSFKPTSARNEMFTYQLDLTEVLKDHAYGFVYYQVELQTDDYTAHRRGLVQVTNLAVTGKFSPENCLFMATSLDKAEPLAKVEATILDDKGRALWRGETDEKGLVKAPGWADLTKPNADDYAPPLFLFLKNGEDEAYVQNGEFGQISTWQFDISRRWSSSEHYLTSKVYTERGLYRPGEKVHLKGSLRDRDEGEWILPQVSKVEFIVKNSRDEKIEEGKVGINEFGTFHHTIQLSEKAPTGSYRVDYHIPADLAKEWQIGTRISGVTFRVEEFEAAQFEVNVTSPAEALVMGQKAPFEIEGKWLFGAPMNEAQLEWDARIEPAVYSSEDYPGFQFGPSYSGDDDDRDETKTLKKGEAKTDATGFFKAELSLEGIPYRGDADLVIEGTVTSSNRRSITGAKSIPVARGQYRVGLKPSSRFLPAEAPVEVKLITLTPDGKPMAAENLKLELIRREWSSVKKSDVDGRFNWVTEVEDKVVETKEHNSGKKESSFEVTPKEAGYYIVRATGSDESKNTIITETDFYAHGSGYVPWGRSEGDTIELVADKTKYAPGDTAKILIKNPFEEATALVTYERDLILYSYTTTLIGSAPVLEVPITEEHLPNLYVSVMLFRGRIQPPTPDDTEDIGKPAFKIGYIDLPVAPDSKRLKVEVSTDKERYGPADEVVTKLKVTDVDGNPVRAELSLAAADVGVLNLINFKTPDLFDTYYRSMPLAVQTAESRLDVIGQRSYGAKGEDSGGGGGYNPGFRKDFKSTAVWEPEVVTNSQGEAEVRFELPENLTTFRVMATAISGDTKCGAAELEIITTKPLILKASTPAFARIGDDFQAGVLAVNGTDKGASVHIKMESDGVQSSDPESRDVFLKPGEEREILFSYKAEAEGTAKLRFSGTMGEETDGIEYQLPLQLATQRVHLAHTGNMTDKTLKQGLEVPKTAVAGTAKVEVKLSSSILLGLESSVKELLDYPYGCLEQRLSRVTPLLYADQLVDKLELKGWDKAKVKSTVQETLDKIPNYAHSNGGLKVWPDSAKVHPFLTARAMTAAHLAKTQGYKINGAWLDKSRAYLKKFLDGTQTASYKLSESEELVCRAAALDALTRYGFSGKAYLNKLLDKRDKMPVAGRAYLLQVAYRLDRQKTVETLTLELTNSLKLENATAYFDIDESTLPWLFSSDIRDTGLVLEALLNSEQKINPSDKIVTWLLEARNAQGTWGTTANNAAALSALVAYAREFEGPDPSFSVTVNLDGKTLGEESFSQSATQYHLTQELHADTKPELELKKSTEGRLYYDLALSYEDTQASPAKDEGMTVLRAITDLEGKAVTQVKGGEIYKVQLSVVAPSLRRYVVLRDPVPAGLSVVKTDFATESSRLSELLKRGAQPSWQTFHRFEDYNDRILLFADALAPGEHTYEYLVRAQTPGQYLHPAAQAEEMYHPELFGRTSERTLVVK